MRQHVIVWLLIATSMLVAIVIDYYLWPNESAMILYALPLAIAARYTVPSAVVGIAALVMALNIPSVLNGRFPWELSAIKYVSLGLIAVLAWWVAQARQEAACRLREIARGQEQLREFMGMVVHDLRNPLGVALGYLQLVQSQVAHAREDVVADRLRKVERALARMRRLTDDLLDATRVGGNCFIVRRVPLDLAELTRQIVEEHAETANNHHLVVEAPEHLYLDGDPDRLRQVVTNLVSNAVKYSPEHTVITIKVADRGDRALVSVHDQGPGIARATLDELFQPFTRLAQAGEATGTGLGLYIAKGIVEAHGGRIWVESAAGQGSTFFVELPRHSS